MKEIEPNEGPITLRMGKDNGKVGVGQRKPMGFNKTAPLKHRSDKNLRGREEKVLRVLKVLIASAVISCGFLLFLMAKFSVGRPKASQPIGNITLKPCRRFIRL